MKLSKILIIVPSFHSGGTISSLINFISLVDQERFHISVFGITNTGPNKQYVAEHCTIVGEDNRQQGNTKTSFKSEVRTRLFLLVKAIKKGLEKLNIDISPLLFKRYARSLDTGEYDYVLAFQEGQATLFGSYFKNGIKIAWVRSEYTRFIENTGDKYKACYEKYDKIVSVSKAALASFLSVHPEFSDRAFVQYNFLNDERIRALSLEKVDDLWDNRYFTIVSLGRIDPVKRISEIPRLCRELRDLGLEFKWVIIGGVAVKDEYTLFMDGVDKYHVQDSIIVLGNKPNPYPYLKHSSLLVSLSKSETFNNTLTEAKILGIPVVTTDYPCAYESIADKEEGLIAAFEDIIQAISDMINDNDGTYTSIKNNLVSFQYDKDVLLQNLYANILN